MWNLNCACWTIKRREHRGRKEDRARKGADEGGPREICKADFRIEHTLLEVSRGCWIVRASPTNTKRKYFFLFVYRSIALSNWLVRKQLHTRDLDLIPSSSWCLYRRTRVRTCFCVLFQSNEERHWVKLTRISLNVRTLGCLKFQTSINAWKMLLMSN